MADCNFEILRISDGTLKVDLVSPRTGFCVKEWQPGVAVPKRGGIWADSSLNDGRRLRMRKLGNVTETFTFDVRAFNVDDLAEDKRNLRTLLDKAAAYDPSTWQDEPVWIEARSPGETNSRYLLLWNYETPQDGNPHGSEGFWAQLGKKADTDFVLIVEREPSCFGNPPGTGTCVEASAQQQWGYGWSTNWALNTNQPVSSVWTMTQLSSGRILAGETNEVWRTDNGIAWNAATVPPGLATEEVMDIVELPSGSIICSTLRLGVAQGGVYRSVDGGVNWASRTVVVWRRPVSVSAGGTALAYRPSDGYLYFASEGATGFNLRRSNDEGATWADVLTVGNPWACFVTSDGTILASVTIPAYASMQVDAIYRSTDGTTFTQAATFSLGVGHSFNDFAQSNETDTILGMGTDGTIIVSHDDGLSWSFISSLVVGAGSVTYQLQYFNGRFFATVTGPGGSAVYMSEDDGFSWIDIGGDTLSPRSTIQRGTGALYIGEDGDIYTFDIDDTVTTGRSNTCANEVFLSNKRNVAQVTNVLVYDAAPVTWTAEFPAVTFPFNLFPVVPAVGDILYIGIDTSVIDSGPLCNVAFDVSSLPGATSWTLAWEYSDGVAGWPSLNVYDETVSFQRIGVGLVSFVPQSGFAQEAVNGITGLWIRARITAIAGSTAPPTQGNRDIYTVNWNHIDIAASQVPGDRPPLLQLLAHNRSDEDGLEAFDELDLFANRVIAGVRSTSRNGIVSIVNCTDVQNPAGIRATAGTGTVFANDIQAPTGRVAIHTTQGRGLNKWDDAVLLAFGPSIAAAYYGIYAAYVRAHLYEPDTSPAGDNRDVRVRLQIRSGSGGILRSTPFAQFTGWDAWVSGARERFKDFQLLDMLRASLPASGLFKATELPDALTVVIQVASAAATNLRVAFYDAPLIPADEWIIDAQDVAFENDSGITNGRRLNVDSVTFPKRTIRAPVQSADASALIYTQYLENTAGPAILQANADQAVHFLAAQALYRGKVTALVDAQTLTDSRADFELGGIRRLLGLIDAVTVYNVTTGNSALVNSLDSTNPQTVLNTDTIPAGWNVGDEYQIVAPNWVSKPYLVHSVQLYRNSRYHSLRGAG